MNRNKQLILLNFIIMMLVCTVSGAILGPVLYENYVFILVAFILCVIAIFTLNLFKNTLLNYIVTYTTTILLGITTYSLLLVYTGSLGLDVVLAVFVACFFIFGLCAVIATKSNYDFSTWGNILFFCITRFNYI